MALNFKTLLTRTVTAAVFVAVLLSAICWNAYSFGGLFFVVAIWGLLEFYSISAKLGAKPFIALGILTSTILYFSFFPEMPLEISSLFPMLTIGITFPFLFLIAALFSKNENPIADITFTVFGVFYCTVPFITLNNIINLSYSLTSESFTEHLYNSHIVLGMILLIWACDTYAYLVGSMIGKRKLYERISPGKTWEGTIGGGVLTMASSYIVAGWFPELAFKHWLVISVLVIVFGTLGDLFESLLKRQAGIKDSGKIMPGHGGVLDRFDSLMFVAPFVYLYLSWVL